MKFVLLSLFISTFALAGPDWFAKDYRNDKDWVFYCTGDADSEEKALQMAQSNCASKMCMLFGVEVESKTETNENLKESKVEITTVQKCPNVRIVGRLDKKKSVECEDKNCQAFIMQVYPKSEYDKEFQRLNQPAISKVLEQTIIVREGNDSFKDPAACQKSMTAYKDIRGESPVQSEARITLLKTALVDCKDLDYRNVHLQSELQGYLITSMSARTSSAMILLNQILTQGKDLLDKLGQFLKFEETLKKSDSQIEPLKRLIAVYYDDLFSRENYIPERKEYELANGSRKKTDPYLDEMKTCRAAGQVMVMWPENLSQEISVCVPKIFAPKEQDCNSLNYLTVRARYSGCICQLGAPAVAQECTRIVLMHMNEQCPGKFTPECFARMSKLIAERLNSELPVTFPKSK